MSATDLSKSTKWDCYCGSCKETVRIAVDNQRTPKPQTCPLCANATLLIEKATTFPRRRYK